MAENEDLGEAVPPAEKGGPAHWLDEFWSVVLAVPLLASFLPRIQDFVSMGFVILGNAPAWYLGAVALSIAWAFGRRALSPLIKNATGRRS